MKCGDMTRIVDEVSALEMLEANMEVDGEMAHIVFTDEQKEKFGKERVAILLCPKCQSITQMRADMAKTLRTKWLLRQK